MKVIDKNTSPRTRRKHIPFRNSTTTADPGGLLDHLQVVYQPPDHLVPAEVNARTHSPKQIRQIAASIERFGFINPILVNDRNQVLAGHGRPPVDGIRADPAHRPPDT